MEPLKAAHEFRALYFTRVGVQLSDEEALEQAGRLLRLYKAVYGAIESGGAEESREKTV